MHGVPRWRRIIRAAGRLAALYVGTALVLLLVAGGLIEGVLPTLSDLIELWIPVGLAFLIAFLLLAIARRAGFVALWALLLGLWVLTLVDGPHPWLGQQFVAWTVLGLPLYALGMIGAPSTQQHLRKTSLGLAVVWLFSIAAAFMVAGVGTSIEPPSQIREILFRNATLIWGPFPFVLGAHEVVRVWNATSKISTTAAA